jgi:ferritin-like metal-binding protein YciE
MGLFTKDIKSMDDLFVHTLQDIYYAEQQIAKALPKMIDKANSPELKQAFTAHQRETEGQVLRLEEVFRLHGKEPKGVKCEAINGIIDEAESIMGNIADPEVLDAAILASAQAVEHYEITRYGTLATWARTLGREDCARLLHQTLEEERATDERLTRIAESRINRKAA